MRRQLRSSRANTIGRVLYTGIEVCQEIPDRKNEADQENLGGVQAGQEILDRNEAAQEILGEINVTLGDLIENEAPWMKPARIGADQVLHTMIEAAQTVFTAKCMELTRRSQER